MCGSFLKFQADSQHSCQDLIETSRANECLLKKLCILFSCDSFWPIRYLIDWFNLRRHNRGKVTLVSVELLWIQSLQPWSGREQTKSKECSLGFSRHLFGRKIVWRVCMYGQECMQTFNGMYLCRLGVIDSSGMRIYHTKQLREYDAGVLHVGASVDYYMAIPPRQRDWQTNGFCTKDCLMKVRGLEVN